jgi:X-X-X-Leu-X-X-Gly heptad repeat protein
VSPDPEDKHDTADDRPAEAASSSAASSSAASSSAASSSADPSSADPSSADPAPVASDESRPVSSGKVTAVGPIATAVAPVPVASISDSGGERRSRRISDAAKDALDAGVRQLGSGIGTLGDGVSKLGEGVSKLGDMSRNVPVVGSSVARIGEGISHVGEQLHELPKVARTRRGRLLIRSMIVGFVLVAAWIVMIVALQLHGNDTPDFRPNAERILVGLSKGEIDEVYEQASPRFQEMVRKERFSDDMTDMTQTVGKFREITAVNDSLVTTGPTGRTGRVALTVKYEKATCKVAVSLHYDQDRWKLLGIGIDLPPELTISQAQREDRVKACKDPMDIKHCDVHQAADAVLHLIRDGRADQVWDSATTVFQKQESKAKFVQLQLEHLLQLGSYRRIIAVSEAKVIGGTLATFDTLAEFDKASGVRAVFGFYRRSRLDPWKLRSFKVVLPMPRESGEGAASSASSLGTGSAAVPAPSASHLAPRDSGVK